MATIKRDATGRPIWSGSPNEIHHTRGMYPNGSFKDNGVPTKYLDDHFDYNVTLRPGRGLFVDGCCVYGGSLTDEQIAEMTDRLRKKPVVMLRDTQPYQ